MSHDPAELPADWTAWRDRFDAGSYDDRWARLEAAGVDPHGEVAFVQAYAPAAVLDAGCGTGRVAVELARRGVEVVGVDNDPDMIAVARTKEPRLPWVCCDLADLTLPGLFDVVLLAGNVVPYLAAQRRAAALLGCARHLEPDGCLVAGFALQPGWPTLADYDGWCGEAGLELRERWATWDREPYEGGGYAVSVHAIRG